MTIKHAVVFGLQTEVLGFAARIEVEQHLSDIFLLPAGLHPSACLCMCKIKANSTAYATGARIKIARVLEADMNVRF